MTRAYDLGKWLHEHTARFPRHHRMSLGARIDCEATELVCALVDAAFRRDPREPLQLASAAQARLRVLVRFARDLECISTKQYVYAIDPLEEVGRMIGGWGRHARGAERRAGMP